jgi:hypothetical protein
MDLLKTSEEYRAEDERVKEIEDSLWRNGASKEKRKEIRRKLDRVKAQIAERRARITGKSVLGKK